MTTDRVRDIKVWTSTTERRRLPEQDLILAATSGLYVTHPRGRPVFYETVDELDTIHWLRQSDDSRVARVTH